MPKQVISVSCWFQTHCLSSLILVRLVTVAKNFEWKIKTRWIIGPQAPLKGKPCLWLGFYVDTLSPLWCSIPLALHARAELLVGACLLAFGDKLLITYKEQLASPKNISIKWDSALSRLSPCQPQISSCQQALKPETEVKKLLSVWPILLAGLFGRSLLKHRWMLVSLL